MDIFEFAMQMEKDGEKFYREIAAGVNNDGVKKILTILADEEVKHYQIFSEIKQRTPEMVQTATLKNVKNVFAEMRDSGAKLSTGLGQIELYKQAQELEKKSENFYLEKSGEVTDAGQKSLLKMIAEEEKRHFLILEHIIQFVSRPDHYLEDAEFENIEPF